MHLYTQFSPSTSPSESSATTPHSPCTNCTKRTSHETSSISSSEDNWTDDSSPAWNTALETASLAQQAGTKRKPLNPLSRCASPNPQPSRPTRKHPALPILAGEPRLSCPPDIEEIDLYMPSVEHEWFAHSESETVAATRVSGRGRKVRCVAGEANKGEFRRGRKVKGCGHSCKIQSVRRLGHAKSRREDGDFNPLAW